MAIFEYLEREKGVDRDIIIQAIKDSLDIAAKKSVSGACNVSIDVNPKTGQIDVLSEKEIVEQVINPAQQISLSDAQVLDEDAELGQYIDIVVTPKDFGRIAAQKAGQVIAQKLRSAERDVIHEEYRHRELDIISGTVKRIVRGYDIVVDLGKVEALMPRREYPRTERYQVGDRIVALLLKVEDTDIGGAQVVLSRNSVDFVRKLFEQEVPELSDGVILIDKIVREPGYRTKIVVSTKDRIDPVGACVGVRGVRIKNVIRELNNEKIDVLSLDPLENDLLKKVLSPVVPRKVYRKRDGFIKLVVEDEDYPTVIGKKGMNARLIGRLLESEIKVQKQSEYQKLMAVERAEIEMSSDPTLDQPLEHFKGLNQLLFDQIVETYPTPRKLLLATPDEISNVPGISKELADQLLEELKERYLNTNQS